MKPCQWNDAMFEASTTGTPAPRLPGYGKEVLAYRRQIEKEREKKKRKMPRPKRVDYD